MNVGDETISLLRSAGYVSRSSNDGAVLVEFEDEVVFGFVAIYGSIADLLSRWKSDHDEYLRMHALQVRRAANKRSNMYAVFITAGVSSSDQLRHAGAIEENFVSSRKIVGTGVVSREQLRLALLPLLPVQSAARITEADLGRRLQTRLEGRQGLYELLSAASEPDDLVKGVLAE